MRTGRPKSDLHLTDEERSQLQSFVHSRSLPATLCTRARIVLSSADGELNSQSAERLQLTEATVGKWRARFIERRIAGLYDDMRPGKPRTIDDERVAQLIDTTLHTKPAGGSAHWSVRTAAAKTGISKTSVARYFQRFGLQPQRSAGLRLADDPFIVDQLVGAVGLYLSPPDNALVICANKKRQWQAVARCEPMPPMGHDEERRDTTPLFDALEMFDGAVVATCRPRHRHQAFLAFLREVDKVVPPELDIHCIVDSDATYSHAKLGAWLATRPRWHMHIVATDRGWLRQVERFLGPVAARAGRERSAGSVKQLVQRIKRAVTAHHATCQPFQWTATAESVLQTLHRPC
jgi:putative transposase